MKYLELKVKYKSSNMTLKVPFKGKSTDLWDQMPASTRAPFKLVEVGDNYISMKLKTDTTKTNNTITADKTATDNRTAKGGGAKPSH